MSEVYGTIGSESVRLRGMALEATQRQILQVLSSGKLGGSGGIFSDLKDEAGKSAGKLAIVNKVFGSTIAVITKAGGLLASAVKNLTGGFEGLEDQIRSSDSAIRQSASNLTILARNTEGAASKIYRFAAEGISQLEEQFDVYKKLSNIGGVVAGDFDNLRFNATSLGVSLQEYASLMQENFVNLRIGGQSARRAMFQVTDIAKSIRDTGGEMNDQFMRLGIGANDYGKMILENSMLVGGLAEAQKLYGNNFAKGMMNTTKSVTLLGDAFGFNREVVMKAANEAMQDARNRNIFRNIRDEGKQQMFALMSGLFGGDSQKAMSATIAAYTGRFDEQTAVLAGMSGDLIPKMKDLAALVSKGVDVVTAVEQVGLKQTFERLKRTNNDLAQATLTSSGAVATSANAILNATDMFGDMDSLRQRLTDSTKSLTDAQGKNLDALGQLQRENIRIATSMSLANKTLNNLGLSVALTSQVMTVAMAELAKSMGSAGEKILDSLGYDNKKMSELNKEFTQITRQFIAGGTENISQFFDRMSKLDFTDLENLPKQLKDAFKDVTTTPPRSTNGSAQPAQPANVQTAQPANVQTTQAQPPRLNFGPAASSLIGQLERYDNSQGSRPENQRTPIPTRFTTTVNKGEDVTKQVDQVKALMEQAKLKPDVDYKLNSSYTGDSGRVDIEFLSQEAATRFSNEIKKIKTAPTAPTVVAPQPQASAVVAPAEPKGATAVASAPSSTQVATRTNVADSGTVVNTTAITTALLDQNNKWLDKFETIHTNNTNNVINKLESLTQEFRRLV